MKHVLDISALASWGATTFLDVPVISSGFNSLLSSVIVDEKLIETINEMEVPLWFKMTTTSILIIAYAAKILGAQPLKGFNLAQFLKARKLEKQRKQKKESEE